MRRLLRKHYGIALIAIGFFILSVIGMDRCLPYWCHPDEPVDIYQTLHMAQNNFQPLFYLHPNHFPAMLLGMAIKIGSVSIDEVSTVYLLGRLLTVLFSLGVLLLVYIIARQLFKPAGIALIAASVYAVNPVIADFTKQFRSDIYLTFFILLNFYLFIEYQKNKQAFLLFIGGVVAGLATTSKYPGILCLVPFVFALFTSLLRKKRLPFKKLFILILGVFVGVILGSPYLFLNLDKVTLALVHEARSESVGIADFGPWDNLVWYTGRYFNIMGNAAFISAALGVILLSFKEKIQTAKNVSRETIHILVLYFLSFVVFMSSLRLHWVRWLIPAIPLLAIFAGFASHRLLFRLRRSYITGFFIMLLILPPLLRSGLHVFTSSQSFTANVARQWLAQNVRSDEKFAAEDFLLTNSLRSWTFTDKTLNEYKREGYNYLVVSTNYKRFYTAEKDRYPQEALFYRQLFQESEVARFVPAYTGSFEEGDIAFITRFIREPGGSFGPFGGADIIIFKLT